MSARMYICLTRRWSRRCVGFPCARSLSACDSRPRRMIRYLVVSSSIKPRTNCNSNLPVRLHHRRVNRLFLVFLLIPMIPGYGASHSSSHSGRSSSSRSTTSYRPGTSKPITHTGAHTRAPMVNPHHSEPYAGSAILARRWGNPFPLFSGGRSEKPAASGDTRLEATAVPPTNPWNFAAWLLVTLAAMAAFVILPVWRGVATARQ